MVGVVVVVAVVVAAAVVVVVVVVVAAAAVVVVVVAIGVGVGGVVEVGVLRSRRSHRSTGGRVRAGAAVVVAVAAREVFVLIASVLVSCNTCSESQTVGNDSCFRLAFQPGVTKLEKCYPILYLIEPYKHPYKQKRKITAMPAPKPRSSHSVSWPVVGQSRRRIRWPGRKACHTFESGSRG